MNKIDRRINYRVVIDTETAPIDRTEEKVIPSNMLTYDCGWAIVDKKGNVYRTRSFVNADIFLNEHEAMKSAYYAEKIPQYWQDIHNGTRILAKWETIKRIFCQDCKEFEVKEAYAHNMPFDYGTLKKTDEWVREVKWGYFFPKRMEICDTLRMSRDVLNQMPTYKKFCVEHGFLTKNGQCRFTAEIIYRYITKDIDFVESHTGLEDVMIEKEILAFCFKQHKKMRRIYIEN